MREKPREENFQKEGTKTLEGEDSFERKRTNFFSKIALHTKDALKMHKRAGLWEKKEGRRDWGNVSEHCLVVVARAMVLAEKLNLSEDIKKDIAMAAALHDFFKKGQKEVVTAGGLTWDSFEAASKESARQVQEAGFDERIVRLVNSTGAEDSIQDVENVLKQKKLSEEDAASLILHYVDDYTIGSDWANPVESLSDGRQINDLDRRVDKNISNQRYAILNEEGKKHFHGQTLYDAQRRVGHLNEERLVDLINEKGGQLINPKDLPYLIDQEIKAKIEAQN